MARAIWSGSISFGLVNVPVKAYSAVRDHDVHFHQLDKKSGARVRNTKVSEKTGREVKPDDIRMGFEVGKGTYVTFDKDELAELKPESTRAIEITDFVDLDEIDPIYFRKAYYLEPQEGAETPYRLLVRALEETNKVAIAKVVIRNKQHLAALRPWNGVLVLETMYYADEVAEPDSVGSKGQLRKAEVEMAKSLVENLSAKFDPEKYDDTYRKELLELLRAKEAGKPLPEPDEEPEGEVVDLMAALRESVEKTQKKGGGRKRARKAS